MQPAPLSSKGLSEAGPDTIRRAHAVHPVSALPTEYPPNDLRAHDARWQPGNYETNQAVVRDLGAIAEWKGCTVAQLALGWLLAQGQDIVPIPGTRSAQRVAENVAAAHLSFTPEGLDLIGSLLPKGAVGDRYPAPMMPA